MTSDNCPSDYWRYVSYDYNLEELVDYYLSYPSYQYFEEDYSLPAQPLYNSIALTMSAYDHILERSVCGDGGPDNNYSYWYHVSEY